MKNSACCVGVTEAEADVTVGEADNVFVGDAVTELDFEADSETDSEADSEAVIVAEKVGVGEAETPALCDGVLLSDLDAEYVAEKVGVNDEESDAPTIRWQMHCLDAVHSSVLSSSLKYRALSFRM